MARFVVSNRLAGKATRDERLKSREAVESMQSRVASFADVLSGPPKGDRLRRTLIINADAREIESKRGEFSADVIAEPLIFRTPAVAFLRTPTPQLLESNGPDSAVAGIGGILNLRVVGGGKPLPNTTISLVVRASLGGGASTTVIGLTGADGKIAIPYNPKLWIPTVAIVVPLNSFWSFWQPNPTDNLVIEVPPLPKTGPLGWWHQLLGVTEFSETRGKGVKIGIADTGVGPNANVAHVQSAGSFLNGDHQNGPQSAVDAGDHGTHVSGILGARPAPGSGDFSGISPGADLVMARVFPGSDGPGPTQSAGMANNGDIADAIDALSSTHEVDLINLSLGGPQPSEIELDAIRVALERGTLTFCATGNGNGAPVMYPAAYPEAIAVSAVGVVGVNPPMTLASMSQPAQLDHYTSGGIYVAGFSNVGNAVKCTAPGAGIISTVPGTGDEAVPYADMSGTSMASPAACAALATWLSQDPGFLASPRDIGRAHRAAATFLLTLRQLGLNPEYVGAGLPTVFK